MHLTNFTIEQWLCKLKTNAGCFASILEKIQVSIQRSMKIHRKNKLRPGELFTQFLLLKYTAPSKYYLNLRFQHTSPTQAWGHFLSVPGTPAASIIGATWSPYALISKNLKPFCKKTLLFMFCKYFSQDQAPAKNRKVEMIMKTEKITAKFSDPSGLPFKR